jgi:hypothetical protein
VSEEEDQMRREDARLHTLPELQDGVYIHSGREEEESAKRVSAPETMDHVCFGRAAC